MATNLNIAIPGKSIYSTDPRDFALNLNYALWKILSYQLVMSGWTGKDTTKWIQAYEKDTSNNWRMASAQGYTGNFHAYRLSDSAIQGWQYGGSLIISYFETVDTFNNG